MTAVDHLFVIIIAIVHPVAGFFSFRRLVERAAAGERIDRGRLYVAASLQHWMLFGLCLALWAGSGRAWASLGFGFRLDGLALAALGLTMAGAVALFLQYRQLVSASREQLERYRGSVGAIDLIVPRNGNELGRFYGLSVTAGIVEETLWRGFLIWYLAHFMPVWAAAALSSVGFGVAHAYQGPRNVPKIIAVGAVFAAIYLLSGSLWLAMFLHAVVDIAQGRLVYELYRRTDGSAGDSPDDDEDLTEPASVGH